MLYVVSSGEELFTRAKALEAKYNVYLSIKALVQNDMLLPTESLNESFFSHHNTCLELRNIYQPHVLQDLMELQTDIQQHVLNCTLNATDEELETLCNLLSQFSNEEVDVNGIKAEIEKTRQHITSQAKT